MNKAKLEAACKRMHKRIRTNPVLFDKAGNNRNERIEFYQSFTADKIRSMTEDDFCEYIGKLWAMIIWGNKKYVVDKIILDNGFENLKSALIELLYGDDSIINRWNRFQKGIKGMGPACISELLSYSDPDKYLIFNGATVKALEYLEVENLPKYNYQYTGERFVEVCKLGKQIAEYMTQLGFENPTLMTVDYLLWDELPPSGEDDELASLPHHSEKGKKEERSTIHDEMKNKLVDIGRLLGFDSQAEVKIARGAVVDAVWEVRIGNMGKAMYVFEVQSSGSIDSLILNLIKAQANPAVQAVIAVAPFSQLEKIKGELPDNVIDKNKLKLWEFDDLNVVHEALVRAHTSINRLALVPEGFNF